MENINIKNTKQGESKRIENTLSSEIKNLSLLNSEVLKVAFSDFLEVRKNVGSSLGDLTEKEIKLKESLGKLRYPETEEGERQRKKIADLFEKYFESISV